MGISGQHEANDLRDDVDESHSDSLKAPTTRANWKAIEGEFSVTKRSFGKKYLVCGTNKGASHKAIPLTLINPRNQ